MVINRRSLVMRSLMYSIRKTGAEIGDYVWLDDNANGKQDEIEYAVPEGTAETGILQTAAEAESGTEDADTGNLVYDPDWGDGLRILVSMELR